MKKLLNKIKRYKVISFVLRTINSGYGYCEKCGLPWNCCEEKGIMMDLSSGFFSICKHCWENSTIDEIEKYHIKSYHKYWKTDAGKSDNLLPKLIHSIRKEYGEDINKSRRNKIISIKNRIKKESII